MMGEQPANEELTLILLAGGNAKRFGEIPKPIYPIKGGKSPMEETIDRLVEINKDFALRVALRPPHDESISNWLDEVYGDRDCNLRRIIFDEGSSKSHAIYTLAEQETKTPYIAVFNADVIYTREILTDIIKKSRFHIRNAGKSDAGMLYLAKSDCPGAKIETKTSWYTKDKKSPQSNFNSIIPPEQVKMVHNIVSDKKGGMQYHPIVTVFDVEKLLGLRGVPKESTKEERAGLTYLYIQLIKKGYGFKAIETDFYISDMNTPEIWRDLTEKKKTPAVQTDLFSGPKTNLALTP